MTFLDRDSFDEKTCNSLLLIKFRSPQDHNFTDDDLARILALCPNVRAANFCGIRDLSDRTLGVLASTASALKVIDISGCQGVTDVGACELAKCTTLESVKMNDVRGVGDRGVSALVRSLPRLARLEVRGLPMLSALSVRDIWTSGRKLGVLKLARCPRLTDKAFPHPLLPTKTAATPRGHMPEGLDELPPLTLAFSQMLPVLRQLDISQCPQLTENALAGVLTYAPHVDILNITECDLHPPLDLARKLTHFIAPNVRAFSDADVMQLVRGSTKTLTTVDLSRNAGLGDLALLELATLPALRVLLLNGVPRLTDAGLGVLAEAAPALKALQISHCPGFSLAAIHAVLLRIPSLNFLNICGIQEASRTGLRRFAEPVQEGYNEEELGPWGVFRGANLRALVAFLDKEAWRKQECERLGYQFEPRSDDSRELY